MTDTWTTAYLTALAAPEPALDFLPPARAFQAQTLRQRVRLRRGGANLRLVLSNEFGRTPLVIDEATVGTDDVPGVPVLSQGARRWQIPAGATATSDPVPLAVAAGGAELVVSLFVGDSADPASYLHSAQTTARIGPGNQLDRREFTDPEESTSLYWITRVLVDSPATHPVIVAIGDSISRGDRTRVDREQRYPDHLQRRLLAAGAEGAVVLNAGIGGNRLLRPGVGPSVTDRFARDVLDVAEASHVIILAGVNDLGLPLSLREEPVTAGDLVDGLIALADRAKQRGIQPVLATITPFGSTVYPSLLTSGTEDARQAVNAALCAQKDWPVMDFARAGADPADLGRLAAEYDSGDGLHPGDAGARALADAVDLATIS